MPAEKKDGHNEAGNANADSPGIFSPQRRFPDRSAPDPLSALSPEQNPEGPLRVYSPERTSELAIRPVCCSSWPIQRPASGNRATPDVQAAAVFPSRSDGHKAVGPREIEPDLRWPEGYCRT